MEVRDTHISAGFVCRRVMLSLARTIMFFVISAAISAIPTLFVIATSYYLRRPNCVDHSFIQSQPFLGDFTINLMWFFALAGTVQFFLLEHFTLQQQETTRAERGYIWFGRSSMPVVFMTVLYCSCHAERLCLSDGWFKYKTTLGEERAYLWSDIDSIKVYCDLTFRGANVGFSFMMNNLRKIDFDKADFTHVDGGVDKAMAHLDIVLSDLRVPITTGVFNQGCTEQFPELRISK